MSCRGSLDSMELQPGCALRAGVGEWTEGEDVLLMCRHRKPLSKGWDPLRHRGEVGYVNYKSTDVKAQHMGTEHSRNGS